jgi:hypothetical protein
MSKQITMAEAVARRDAAAEEVRALQEALKEVLSPAEFQAIHERAELLAKLREDDAARGIIWPADTALGLQ